MKVSVAASIMGLVTTLGFLVAPSTQFAFALNFGIQSNGDSSGSIVCDPNCHLSSNSGDNKAVAVLMMRQHINLLSMYHLIHPVPQQLVYL